MLHEHGKTSHLPRNWLICYVCERKILTPDFLSDQTLRSTTIDDPRNRFIRRALSWNRLPTYQHNLASLAGSGYDFIRDGPGPLSFSALLSPYRCLIPSYPALFGSSRRLAGLTFQVHSLSLSCFPNGFSRVCSFLSASRLFRACVAIMGGSVMFARLLALTDSSAPQVNTRHLGLPDATN